MLIKNITDKTSPKPIGIGDVIIMPGDEAFVDDSVAYVNEVDRANRKTGKKVILPSIILLAGMNQITYEETKVEEATAEEPVKEPVEEPVVEQKPKRGRKKAE